MYDGGIRVPGIVRWPGRVKPGTETSTPAAFVDLLPTFCDLAGVGLPKARTLDGMNIRPLFEGKNLKRTKPLFWFFYKSDPMCAVRDGDYKLCASAVPHFFSKSHPFDQTDFDFIKSAAMTRFELYDLKNDIGEKVDLSSQRPEIRDRLKEQLLKIHADVIAEGRAWEGLPKE
jgi:arylsulfatase A